MNLDNEWETLIFLAHAEKMWTLKTLTLTQFMLEGVGGRQTEGKGKKEEEERMIAA